MGSKEEISKSSILPNITETFFWCYVGSPPLVTIPRPQHLLEQTMSDSTCHQSVLRMSLLPPLRSSLHHFRMNQKLIDPTRALNFTLLTNFWPPLLPLQMMLSHLTQCTPIVVVKMIIILLCGQGEKSIQTIPHSIKHPTTCNFSTQCYTWLTTNFYNHLQPMSWEWTQDIQSSIYLRSVWIISMSVQSKSDRGAAEKHLSCLLLEEWKTDHPKALWDEWVWQKVSLGS